MTYSNAKMKFAKKQVKAKQNPEAELLLLRNYSLSSSTLSSKNNKRYSETCVKNKFVCFHLLSYDYMINGNENEVENEK